MKVLDVTFLLFLWTVLSGQGVHAGFYMNENYNGVDDCARECCNYHVPSRIFSYSHDDRKCVCTKVGTAEISWEKFLKTGVAALSRLEGCMRNWETEMQVKKIKLENAVELCAQLCCNMPNYSQILSYDYNKKECTCKDIMGKISRTESPFFPSEADPSWEKCDPYALKRINKMKHKSAADLCGLRCCNLSYRSSIRHYDHAESRCICENEEHNPPEVFDKSPSNMYTPLGGLEKCDINPNVNMINWSNASSLCAQKCCNLAHDSVLLYYEPIRKKCTCKRRDTGEISFLEEPFLSIRSAEDWKETCENKWHRA